MSIKRIRLLILLSSILLFVVSLTQKCYCTTNGCGDSLAVLITGAFGVFSGGAALTWLANPVLITAWISIRIGPMVSLIASSVSLLTSLSFMLFSTVIDDEAGHYNGIVGYCAGYWLWTASSLVMFGGNLLLRKMSKANTLVQAQP